VNQAPGITSDATTTATSEQEYSYAIVATDAEGNDIPFSVGDGTPAWLTLTDNGDGTAFLTGTPTNADVGTVTVSVTASDGHDNSTQTFELTVTPVNHAPSFASSLAPLSAIAYSPFLQVVTASDADAEAELAITVVSKPDWLTVHDNGDGTATLTGIPTAVDNGANSLTLAVSDGDKGSQHTFAIEVTTPRWTFQNGILGVYGSNANDNIQVWTKNGQLRVVRNGVTKNFPLSGVTNIEIYGFDGDDFISANTRTIPVYAQGNTHNDTLVGGDEPDNFVGGGAKDSLSTGGGDDRLDGFTGKDTLVGGPGNDRILGGEGNDVLFGNEGIDSLFGGEGDDVLYSRDKSADFLSGGDGSDSAQSDSLDVKDDVLSVLP
jgi:Ca2+-binding RTX toxin-like protein